MRKVLLIVLFLFSNGILNAQFVNFDSSEVIASSPNYDYRNPTHCSNAFENVYSFNSIKSWMAYEQHSNDSTSNIIVRQYDYEGYSMEIEITNDTNTLNINPSISGEGNSYMIVWESNKRGNWDIYFSTYNGNVWSIPVLLDSSINNKNNPALIKPSGDNYFLLAYKMDSMLQVKIHHNFWSLDTSLSFQNSELNYPVFSANPYGGNTYLSFSRKGNDSLNYNHSKLIHYNPTSQVVTWGATITINAFNPGQPRDLPGYDFNINFDIDTLGKRQAVSYGLPNGSVNLLAGTLPGSMTKVTNNQWPVVIADGVNYIQAFAALYKTSDSAFICAINGYNISSNFNNFRFFYLGDSTTSSNLSMGNVSYSPDELYLKYRVVWEQEINGRMALVESYMIDVNSSLLNISSSIPDRYSLHQNYPNPFNPSTSIRFEIPKQGFVSLKVFDSTGREAAELVREELQPGVYEYSFDGSGLGSGVYFYKLQSGNYIETRRMVLVK